MPKRPREHELEALSRRAFEAAVPVQWVVRKPDDDYGVDAEVEIFEEGEATGLTFKVQLKGTDARRPSRDVEMDRLRYWRSLDVPVLVVLLHAPSGGLYARWAHAHDPHLYPREPPTVTTAFTFTHEETLSPERVAALAQDVRVYRQLRSGFLPRPVPVAVRVEDGLTVDVEALFRHLRSETIAMLDLIRFERVGTRPQLTIHLTGESISAQPPVGYAGITMHLGPGVVEELPLERLAVDILVLVAVEMSRLGNPADSCRIASDLIKRSLLAFLSPEIATELISAMLHQNRIAELLGTAIAMLTHEHPEVRITGELFMGAALSRQGLDRDDLAALRDALLTRADLEIAQAAAGDLVARVFYNCSLLALSLDDPQGSLDLQDRAIELDPTYAGRHYLLRERAGNLFRLGRFEESGTAYEQAKQADGPDHALVLAADAWMAAGQYRRAEQVLNQRDRTPSRDALGTVLTRILELIKAVVGVDSQDRSPSEDLPASTTEELLAYLRESDALDPRAWARLLEQNFFQELIEADAWLLVATRIQEEVAWVAAITYYAIRSAAPAVLAAAIDTALFNIDAYELLAVLDELNAQMSLDGDAPEQVRARMAEIDDQRSHLDGSLAMRLSPGGPDGDGDGDLLRFL